ncbi:DUF4249 family protein [Chitinophaga sp. SYP-B3965]|uniref:DUF4249 domain-containing protein n=1 Tax=Chitinophaga sp. SYP-B3965 TaxID=2663120 RepID=UPI0012999A4D|nr:DUF4249 domain-containing protein [Chitinophaga sp. SYP-B3965]MRG48453.1 DUF4249 family protein [Chitinophaga sp. SYP-B3965]
MRYLQYILLLFIATCFLACETDVVVKIPSEMGKPVINVLMNKDSIIYARITISGKQYWTNDFHAPKDAVVQLFENDQYKETLTYRERDYFGYYCSTTKMELGHTYKVTASIRGLEQAEGTDVIPDSVVIGEVKRIEVRINDTDVDNKVILELKDKAGERNYYRVRIFSAFPSQTPDGSFVFGRYGRPTYIKSDDPSFDLFDEGGNEEVFMDDKLFDGRNPRFVFNLESKSYMQYIIVEVSSLTYDSYRYLKTSYLALRKAENPLTEKVLVFNNVKNGMGVVGGIAMREYILKR